MTPDEKLMIKLYRTAGRGPIDIAHLGQKETALKNIIKHLAQANFVKKIDDRRVCLTEHGYELVLKLLNLNESTERK
jgi:Mn-dependent DtxR family transcriptional regulator